MTNTITIDVASFFDSGYKKLSWSIQDEADNGISTSLQENSETEKTDIHEALKDHIINITNAIQENGDLIDFEITLSFSPEIKEEQRELFTDVFNEYNTRDERT